MGSEKIMRGGRECCCQGKDDVTSGGGEGGRVAGKLFKILSEKDTLLILDVKNTIIIPLQYLKNKIFISRHLESSKALCSFILNRHHWIN